MGDPVAVYYNQLADRYGDDPRAVDASSLAALWARYRVLGEVADMNGKRVLEVGCGHGLLGEYLAKRHPAIRYSGIDVSEGLIKVGCKHRPELDLQHADLFTATGSYDIVLGQGLFYLLSPDEYPGQMIRRMWELANEAVAFTAISTWKTIRNPGELHLDPSRTLEFCRKLTPWVTLRHDYWLGDVAVYMFRKEA